MKKLVLTTIKKIIKWGVISLFVLVVLSIIFDDDSSKPTDNKSVVEETNKPTEPTIEPTSKPTTQPTLEPTIKPTPTKKPVDTKIKKQKKFLIDFGYPEVNKMKDSEIKEIYQEIKTALKSYGKTIDEMRSLVETYSASYTPEEVAKASDYEIFMEYGYLEDKGTFNVDAEEDNTNESFIVDKNNIVEWFRNATPGDSVQITGKVMGVYNISGETAIQLSFYIDNHKIYITCEGNIDISNVMEGDIITVSGTYKGKNSIGYAIIETQSVSLN